MCIDNENILKWRADAGVILLVFIIPRREYHLLALVSFWFVWVNLMTTATSLRFEDPKLTHNCGITFPAGILVVLVYFLWTIIHVDTIFKLQKLESRDYMNIIQGVILFIISTIGYIGQAITAFWPETATKLGLAEPEVEVDLTFYADVRGEVLQDTAILWALPAAGLLLVLNSPLWVGLVGGGIYFYFAGRGIVVHRVMQRCGIRIGMPGILRVVYTILTLWGLAAVITIVMTIANLPIP